MTRLAKNDKATLVKTQCGSGWWYYVITGNDYFEMGEQTTHFRAKDALIVFEQVYGKATWIRPVIEGC